MQKWEYLVAACILNEKNDQWQFVCGNKEYPNTQVMLNALGEDGWELASSAPFTQTSLTGMPRMPNTHTNYVELYLKRQRV